jgi:hypothetical protein
LVASVQVAGRSKQAVPWIAAAQVKLDSRFAESAPARRRAGNGGRWVMLLFQYLRHRRILDTAVGMLLGFMN